MGLKDENYINIQGWMINKLKLKGNDLLLFALIYGFSQDDESEFRGSQKYMCEALNCSRPTVAKSLKNLVDMELITKRIETVNSVTFNRYKVSSQGVKKLYMGGKETLHGGGKETCHYNTINDNTIDIDTPAKDAGALFPDKNPNKKSLFRNSVFNDFKLFEKQFEQPEFKQVDLSYYFHSVKDWSDSANKMRTARGWIATARSFMRGDTGKNTLKMKHSQEQDLEKHKQMMNYLNGFE